MVAATKPADFSGYATKAGLKCSDGRTIMPEAFKHMDGKKVPLVWQHVHDDPDNVLGHALLEAREDGVYAYAFFNETSRGQNAKLLVQHEDITQLSIYANKLVEKGKSVFHGVIREVSLVMSGANPGALIDNVSIAHGDGEIQTLDDEAIIYTGLPIEHDDLSTDSVEHAADDATIRDVYNTLDEDQKKLVHFMVAEALSVAENVEHSDDSNAVEDDSSSTTDEINEGDLTHQEGTEMTHNVFEQGATTAVDDGPSLTHDQMKAVWEDAHKLGSFKQAFLAHAGEYGVTNIDMLFPDAKSLDTKPEWITRRMEWVERLLNGARKVPWARIKSMSADLTHEEARAKGYIKGNVKKEQFFAVAKRETTPKTIYKKQKLDRDDIIDITDFDIVAWFWVEMYFMLREEIARAVLIGDGREIDDEDKIDETKIRPIARDDLFYTDQLRVAAGLDGHELVEQILLGREAYKGSNPTLFATQAKVTTLLLSRDTQNRRLYRNLQELASELQVADIVYVPVLEGAKVGDDDIWGVLVNMGDYSIGSDRGGEITKFDDFDIDLNQYKYLIEGRMSGALTRHKTAQVILVEGGDTLVTPTVPTFNSTTGVVTIPSVTGVVYKNADTGATLSAGAQSAIASGATIEVEAVPAADYYFPHNFDADWEFTRD